MKLTNNDPTPCHNGRTTGILKTVHIVRELIEQQKQLIQLTKPYKNNDGMPVRIEIMENDIYYNKSGRYQLMNSSK